MQTQRRLCMERPRKRRWKEGEILIVPKDVEHRPHTNGEIVFNLFFETKCTLHTGTVESEITVKGLGWI